MTKSFREAQIGPGDSFSFSDVIARHIDHWDEAILRAFEELSLSSIR
jgi:hypothetical protein